MSLGLLRRLLGYSIRPTGKRIIMIPVIEIMVPAVVVVAPKQFVNMEP